MLTNVETNRFIPAQTNIGTPPDPVIDQTLAPGASDIVAAAFRQENLLGSMLAREDMGDNTIDPDYRFDAGVMGTKYEPYLDRFAKKTFNPDQQAALMRQIDREEDDRTTLQAAGWSGLLAELGAGLFSPENLIPFGGQAYRGIRMGQNVVRFSRDFAAVGALSAGVSELGLQASQEIRPLSESAFAIGGGAILGGILGAGLGAVAGRSEMVRLAREVDKVANTATDDLQRVNETALQQVLGQSAGAAAVRRETIDELSVAGRAAGAAAQSTSFLNPILRALNSPSVAMRSISTRMMENPIYLKKNMEGIASDPAVETLVKEYTQGRLGTAVEQTANLYRDYRKSGGTLKDDEFRREIGKAMRRADDHPVEAVRKAAETWRREVFDPLKDRAIEAGLLPEDVSVDTAMSYLSRVYNRPKIEANEGAFKGIVAKWVRGAVEKEVKTLTTNKTRRLDAIAQERADLALAAVDSARLLEDLPKQIKALETANPAFVKLDELLRAGRSQAATMKAAGDNKGAAATMKQVQSVVANAGKDYADYVTTRNLLQTRARRIRNNIVGREDQVERLRASIADTEASNVDRLWRMHRSVALLEQKMQRASPEEWAEDLAKLRTDFAKVMERSAKAQDRLAAAKAKKLEQAAEAKDGAKAAEIDADIAAQDAKFEAAEARRIDAMNEISARIGELEEIDPEDAVRLIQDAIERRISQAAETVEQATRRMMTLAERLKKADPKIAEARVKALEARAAEIERAYADRVDIGLDAQNNYESYVGQIVEDIFNTVTGRNADADVPRDIVAAKRGPLKERTFNIPDELIEDFLESDVEAVGRRYTRTMAADVELKTKFGSTTLEDQLREVRDDYLKLRNAVNADGKLTPGQKERQITQLLAAEKADIRDMKAVRDMLRGTYLARENSTNFARVAAVASTLNYLRAMGGVVISSATDLTRHLMVHGLSNVTQDGIRPLITNVKAFKMSVAEGKRAGAVAERILNTRMSTWAEITDPYSQRSPFERFLHNVANGFSKANGMVYWNDFQKSFASVLTQGRILRGSVDFAKVKPREKAYLAFLGIDEDMASRIAREFQAHGSIEDGVRVANSDDWTDDVARRTYRAAINKDVDSTIVTKGVGDLPLFASTPTGRLLLQFKSFALASHQRAFIRGMQEGPAGMVSGVITASTIGMFIYALKSLESNRVEDLSDNPGRWIAEGLDRSGLFAIAFEANNTIEKALGVGAYGALASLFPDSDQDGKASRYQVRSTAAALTGPTGDFIDTLVKVTQGITKGDLKESDVNAIRRLAPFSTLPGIRSVVEYMVLPEAKQAVAD